MQSPEYPLAAPLLGFEGGFGFTPWETAVRFSPPPPQPQYPTPAQAQAQTRSGSDGTDMDRAASPDEQRRIRRKISNRESARRSRMRKQRHEEGLRAEMDRFGSENRELADRLAATTHRCLLFCRDNDRLRSEAAVLRRRLCDLQRILIYRQLQRLAAYRGGDGGGGGGGNLVASGEPRALTAPVDSSRFMAGAGQTLVPLRTTG